MFWHFVRRIYSIYCLLLFVITFLVAYPFFLLAIAKPAWWKVAFYTNLWWARVYFRIIFIPIKISGLEHLKSIEKNCVICANHFSYLDIPVMALLPRPFIFVGKASVAKIPLFGYMFRKLHIPVDRASLKSRYATYQHAKVALDLGKDLLFFPEGGILTKNPPHMVPFKEGAFKIAHQHGVPILPITLPDNLKILPDDGKLLPKIHRCHIIIHPPITEHISGDISLNELKQRCFNSISAELRRQSAESFEAADDLR